MNDIQSWWEVPSIAHFCSLFRTAFNLLDFDIEDLEEALLTDGTEEASWLQELIVKLLTGCLPNNEISTFNYQMFLRRLFREKCKEHDRYNPFNTDIDFQLLPLRTKVDILYALCDFRLDSEDVLEQLKNLEADSLRVVPLGYDNNESAYWYFYGTRLYREDFNTKNNKKGKSVWQVVCFTEEDWFQLAKKFKKSASKSEKQLYCTLSENFLPELHRLFSEKERLARKRLLENQPRRTSSRLDTKRKQEQTKTVEDPSVKEEDEVKKKVDDELKKKKELEQRRQEAYERRSRLREGPGSESDESKSRYEMGGKKKEKKPKPKTRKHSTSSNSSRDRSSSAIRSSSRTVNKGEATIEKTKTTTTSSTKAVNPNNSTTVGRQTNNSLASATGQIVIQPVSNPHKKKLKTSLVFRQTDEDLQTGMHKILDYVKNHDDAWPFVDPVEEEYAPNYYSVIRKPMDLQKMEERLDAGYYKSYSRFRGDFQLIVDNCRLYNGAENEYTEMVGNLLTVFEKATDRYLDQITSSDEEIAVEFPDNKPDDKANVNKNKVANLRKPTLAAHTDKKREPSFSEDSTSKQSCSLDLSENIKNSKKQLKRKNVEDIKPQIKKEKIVTKVDDKNDQKKGKKKKIGRKPGKSKSITAKARSRSRSFSSLSREEWDSSPPPSSVPTSPDSIYNKKDDELYEFSDEEQLQSKYQGKGKQKSSYKDNFDKINKKTSKYREHSLSPPKQKEPKDKHNKLRETIEKLKAKSEISNKYKDNLDDENPESQEGYKKSDKSAVNKAKLKKSKTEKITDLDDESNTFDSTHFDKKIPKKETKHSGNNIKYEALTLATEQTLKDINKWLDGTAQSSEFSSASNSPSHDVGDEFDSLGNRKEFEHRKRFDKPSLRKDALSKDLKRRTFHRDPAKFLKKREVQRTIDRLQPGKSKGNLLSNVQNTNKVDELFPLGILSKIKDTRNSLIVKTNESAPKLSLGSVLDSFGKHKFVDDTKKEGEIEKKLPVEEPVTAVAKSEDVEVVKSKVSKAKESDKKVPEPTVEVPVSNESAIGKATPNLSAWFKAFGAPKVVPNQKKPDSKVDTKDNGKSDDLTKAGDEKSKSESRKVISPEISPNPDSPAAPQGQPIPRQRKMSTGSTVSERSSFSQDMDSPRICIDERLGAYPAPYPSPLHRSPSGASPIMASPRPDVSPKSAYPTVNGQIRVGFYQDTVSTKSSPDKSCSPRSNPQSPYPQYSEPVYTLSSTTESTVYAYNNSYYSQVPNYSNPPTPSYNSEQSNPNQQPTTYYDTTKPLTDQYQAKPPPAYHAVNSPNYQNVHSPNYSAPQPPTPNTSNYHSTASPSAAPQLHSPSSQQPTNYESLQPQQQITRIPEKSHSSAMFPVKKRVYNETDTTIHLPNNQPTEHLSYERNYSLGLPPSNPSPQLQELRPSSRSAAVQQYVHQNIPNPRSSNTRNEGYAKNNNLIPQIPISSTRDINQEGMRNVNNFNSSTNLYNYNESSYGVNPPSEGPLDLNARQDPKKIDMSKYTNMGYSGTDIGFTRNPPQYNLNYGRPPSTLASKSGELQAPVPTNAQNIQNNEMMMRYNEAADYRNLNQQKQTPHATNITIPQNTENRLLDVSNSYKPDMPIPRPGYSTPSGLNVDQSLGLRSNLPNLSHIVDRFSTDNVYYSEKGLPGPHIYGKTMATSASNIPMFSQSSIAMPYNHEMQATQSTLYNRQMTELQTSIANQSKAASFSQQPEKKSKRRKNSKLTTLAASSTEPVNSAVANQGFQSYTGLKNTSSIEPSAISLKTASVVPGSAFNFGPTPTGLGLSSGLYGDKDTYPNFLEDYRTAPNYYMAAAAAAAHHRSTPDTGDKQSRTSHQPSPSAAAGYPFIGAPQPRPPSYPLSGSFMSPHQTPPLMDPSSPLYQQYLQAGVLHQGLLGPPGGYPPSYHPALSMRQPFDSMTRPWL